MASKQSINSVINSLDLSWTLKSRINITVDNAINEDKGSFVLYLPTVVLRTKHNPAFALACHVANKFNVPLLILCVVLDDTHYPLTHGCSIRRQQQQHQNDTSTSTINDYPSTLSAVVGTSRRLAFTLQALKSATTEWTKNGAICKIRVHGINARTPHHLSLSRQSIVYRMNRLCIHF
jgi:hypothetical protein